MTGNLWTVKWGTCMVSEQLQLQVHLHITCKASWTSLFLTKVFHFSSIWSAWDIGYRQSPHTLCSLLQWAPLWHSHLGRSGSSVSWWVTTNSKYYYSCSVDNDSECQKILCAPRESWNVDPQMPNSECYSYESWCEGQRVCVCWHDALTDKMLLLVTLSIPRVINVKFPLLSRDIISNSWLFIHNLLRWKLIILSTLTTSLNIQFFFIG